MADKQPQGTIDTGLSITSTWAESQTYVCRWRKYGEKPIGKRHPGANPHPRQYYKCSTQDGCPAKKYVQIDETEPSGYNVQYEGDHSHEMPAEAGQKLPGGVRRKRGLSPDIGGWLPESFNASLS